MKGMSFMIFCGLQNMPISPSYSSFFLFRWFTAFTEQVLLLETIKQFSGL